MQFRWNTTQNDWVHSPNALNEVGCIHTVQGYDLNYAGVIIGPDMKYNQETKDIAIIKENYEDKNGKRTLRNDDELKFYIKNIYKVLLTRGMRVTYIYVVDQSLRRYLSNCFTAY